MDILSPKDGFVSQITAADGAQIQSGTTILELDSLDEDLRSARIVALDKLRKILEIRLSPEVLGLRRDLANLDSDSASKALPFLQDVYRQVLDSENLGHLPPGAAATLTPAILTMTEQKTSGPLQLKIFDLQVAESRRINELAQQHLQKELAFAQLLQSRTAVKAITKGKLHLKVSKGTFVRKAQVICEIA